MQNFGTDKAPVQTVVIRGGVLELNVYVDSDKLTGWRHDYFGGVATINSYWKRGQTRSLSCSFVNAAGLEHYMVGSWALGL